jgi:hypothetical protein
MTAGIVKSLNHLLTHRSKQKTEAGKDGIRHLTPGGGGNE